jgi:hypothetical protein
MWELSYYVGFSPPHLFPFFSILRFLFHFFPPSFSTAAFIYSVQVLLGRSFFLFFKVLSQKSVLLFSQLPSCLCVQTTSTVCRVGFMFMFSVKVEFIILSCLVFPYIFLKNLISVLCILLLCFCVTFKSFLPEFLFFIAERKKTRQNINSRQKIHLASLKKIKYSTTTGRTIHVF